MERREGPVGMLEEVGRHVCLSTVGCLHLTTTLYPIPVGDDMDYVWTTGAAGHELGSIRRPPRPAGLLAASQHPGRHAERRRREPPAASSVASTPAPACVQHESKVHTRCCKVDDGNRLLSPGEPSWWSSMLKLHIFTLTIE